MGLSAAHPQLCLLTQAQPWSSHLSWTRPKPWVGGGWARRRGDAPSLPGEGEQITLHSEYPCKLIRGPGTWKCCSPSLPSWHWDRATWRCSARGREVKRNKEEEAVTKFREWRASAFQKCLSRSPWPSGEGHGLPYLIPEGHASDGLNFHQLNFCQGLCPLATLKSPE